MRVPLGILCTGNVRVKESLQKVDEVVVGTCIISSI